MSQAKRRIDHLVLAVRDLDAAGVFYERLGFQVGARNRHPWGTENRIVQFQSSFLELITVGDASLIPPHSPGHFSFGAFVRDYLTKREGLAMLVLDSDDAKTDAKRFAERGIGSFAPFFFERKGRRPDGSETHVAFTLAFAVDPAVPNACFFVCQQHYPDAFWNPVFQQHSNGATNVGSVRVEAADPVSHEAFLRAFTESERDADALIFALRNCGQIEVAAQSSQCGLTDFSVSVPDVAAVEKRLAQAGIPHASDGGIVSVSAAHCFGVALHFKAEA